MNNIIKINDKKFKSIYISYNFLFNSVKENYGKYSLISEILSKSSNKYKNLGDLQLELNRLYGTNFEVESQKIGDLFNIEFKLEFVNKKYINNDDILDQILNLLYEIIYNPLIENNQFNNNLFNIEKENIIKKIKSRKDDKLKYGFSRVEEILCENENYGKYIYGDLKEIENITSNELYKLYLKMLNESNVYINICGNLEGYEDIDLRISNIFKEKINNKNIFNLNNNKNNRKTSTVFEKVNTKQAVIGIGIDVNNIENEDDKIKMMIYNEILGGNPASKLFQNVREKNSLAYTIRSRYNKIKNYIVILGGIENDKYRECKEVILKQLEDIRKGNVSNSEFIAAKETLIHELLEYNDSKIIVSKLEYLKYLQKDKYSIEEVIDKIKEIKINDIINISNKLEIKLEYFLGGETNE